MWLTDGELEGLMTAESDRSEFKRSLSDTSEIKKTICALANDLADHRRPGVIFVGLNPDGSCANLTITEEMQRVAAAFRSDGTLLPIPSMTVERKCLNRCDLLVIQVEPGDAPPVRFSGRVWVKVGSTKQRASAQDERRLAERVRWNALPYDQHPVPGAGVDQLDLTLFERVYLPNAVDAEVLAANDRDIQHKLSSLRLATPAGQPTYAGILVLGYDLRQWIPGAYVQFVRIEGRELTDPIRDQKELDGPVPELMRQLDDLLNLNIQVRTQIIGKRTEERRPDYPVEALRQLARNAVMHRAYDGTNSPVRIYWFSDRVEILNPGGPFGLVNRENFGKPGLTDYRNPQLAEAMRILGYVQRFGAGIPIARRELEGNGSAPPEFTVESTHVLVTVRGRV